MKFPLPNRPFERIDKPPIVKVQRSISDIRFDMNRARQAGDYTAMKQLGCELRAHIRALRENECLGSM